MDGISPPLHACIHADKPEWLVWLLDHGADIERCEQDYGATPPTTAVVMRQKRITPILVGRGANTEAAVKRARNGMAGAYEPFGLEREGFQEIVEVLRHWASSWPGIQARSASKCVLSRDASKNSLAGASCLYFMFGLTNGVP